MKKFNVFLIAFFMLYIGTFFVLNIITEDESFSVIENRHLQTFPKITTDNIISAKFMTDVETYVTDQFVFRDKFVEIKSITEQILGKKENNGVYISEKNTLIQKFDEPIYDNVDKNLNKINEFENLVDADVYVSVIPTQNDIYEYKLTNGAVLNHHKDLIDYTKSNVSNFISVYDELMEKNTEYLFYGTDHHWTTLGAYYAYEKICEDLKIDAVKLEDLEKVELTKEFYGTTYSSSGVRNIKADSIDIYTENFDIEITDADGTRKASIYDMSKLEQKDKYEVFLGGNDPIVKIFGYGEEKLLIIKDSFTNCQAPFFAYNYEEVHLIDLRYMKMPISEYIEENEIDTVLIQYSAPNFSEDRDLVFLK